VEEIGNRIAVGKEDAQRLIVQHVHELPIWVDPANFERARLVVIGEMRFALDIGIEYQRAAASRMTGGAALRDIVSDHDVVNAHRVAGR
jgi:hypothetical protein